ncbi:NUDIX domain-containing protein [Nostocoides sp. F2B08]|uniref:NUDIX hydrolase n=1 Tax=Nostocoides sp. F2B08 TaxID=2653936 RepID=UPI001263C572|nr:NUDIX domain-containing protein [Tetrasphaera sp. F2B08]KAB7746207.1 NUDIX domain-containing protein [Tetrasphaera sp. F2B08]
MEQRPPRRSPVWHDAVRTLSRYAPEDRDQEGLRTAYLRALEDDTAVFKTGPPVHLTTSCLVFDHTREHVLLTLHAKARSWLQLGGHIEPGDPDLLAAVHREVREESGIDTVRIAPRPAELHRHGLSARFGRCSEHLDVRFVGWAPPGSDAACSAESLDLRWWPVDTLPPGTVGDLPPLIARGQNVLRDLRGVPFHQG